MLPRPLAVCSSERMVIRLPLDAFLLNQPLDRSPRGAKPTCDLPNGQLGLLQELDRLFSLCGDEEKQYSSSHYQEATYMNRVAQRRLCFIAAILWLVLACFFFLFLN
ncbi:hypothetical protein Krac_11400 [Ktedonobacter racemifer DSM 44963]|uniref:Uncharacterized protein n=1 Tax=Ktedonobacter racemifer DSM 44963 TaxID=485913 RepID=D6TBP2_KTERA|nr:hypothetical protein Krac_11400 [Ktedonobacter racemifer DSM 44963]